MPLTITELSSKTATTTVHYEDDSFAVEYYPKKFTLKTIMDAQTGDAQAVIGLFVSLVKSWEIYEDTANKHMTPITPGRLAEFPIDLLGYIMEAIVAAIRPEARTPQLNGAR